MTGNFASLALARLYEKQGYMDDALEIYKTIDTSRNPDAENVLDAISRLEVQKQTVDTKESLKEPGHDSINPDQVQDTTKEARMAHLLEVWLRLIVMQKRVDIFKTIKARL
ncbi:hypothetical protein DO021_14105 [Desulfobacter hydrogenophilus]|uniref:Uncharacterized protein n=1 Tax=Desulfobacter hydrogenophilus TaxID=2291 RepID=A0A328F9P0_9BACT|nr:hypothetical protein [Desulfobacter hydrogenophilus]NDY72119.1 hypothetical protein [Desulfobacter hydrogenophilus]QBH14844.1 hypothetical protein EYB58_19135 [Desulfobacter hydrogenophilus]RAM01351.1 hypothetical protein DO021_14105 [Desulfobacter hydrogenophilus]